MNLINHLQNLSTNRFALNQLDEHTFVDFRIQLLAQFGVDVDSSWHLIGTDGCHLCHQAHDIITQARHIKPLPTLQQLDLMDCQHDRIIDLLGVMIPVLITPTRIVCYPFAPTDILAISDDSFERSTNDV